MLQFDLANSLTEIDDLVATTCKLEEATDNLSWADEKKELLHLLEAAQDRCPISLPNNIASGPITESLGFSDPSVQTSPKCSEQFIERFA